MFAALLGAVRADIDRQINWAKVQVKRQTRYTVLMGILAGVAALAALGAVIVGLIALHSWRAMQAGPFIAHGLIGGGLLLLALILFALAVIWQRPRLAARPALQIARPAALLGTLGQGRYDRLVAGGEQTLKLATGTLRDGSGSALLGTLALAVAVGLLVGRRLAGHRAVRRAL
jgi:MFS family permease